MELANLKLQLIAEILATNNAILLQQIQTLFEDRQVLNPELMAVIDGRLAILETGNTTLLVWEDVEKGLFTVLTEKRNDKEKIKALRKTSKGRHLWVESAKTF